MKNYVSSLIKRISRRVVKAVTADLEMLKLKDAYTYFLMELWKEEGLSQAYLYKKIGIEQPTAVRTLDRMERDGFIVRKPSPTDRRSQLIFLTKRSKDLKPSIEQLIKELNQKILKGFSFEEKVKLISYLERISENLSNIE
tara:strand:+ start:261 stop:683 length:423 start_codon:yes stop_codon:yes gene_type:complete